ncbi:MAG: thioredoxin-disulfide reductase [Deltaproteobacteria bacterium]|nr:thioredoxin-disulfide reductase [Deltaproteobacteria bacterium]MBZ0220090.1 thioredoxin-disulfide reductase [Deltaproteobacteria bacterium]
MYDLVIIGGGPAGLTAGIYAQRARLKTVLLEKQMVGGQIAVSDVIENYPGFPSISGAGLMEKFEEHARGLGLEIKLAGVHDIALEGGVKVLKTTEGEIRAKAVIIATGAKPKRLGVPGEKELTGKGVSYCATCDGPFFRNLKVLVVGGGDTAVKEAVYLSRIASKVYISHRRDRFRAEKMHQEKLESTPNIEILKSHILTHIKEEAGLVKSALLDDIKTGEKKSIDVEGVFIFVGINPTTDFADVDKDDMGFIKTDARLQTSMPGVFAAGDCRTTPLLQVATAVGDGAIAAASAIDYIEQFETEARA